MIESILLTTVRVLTSRQGVALTNASGFLFEREERLFLVTSGHVLMDEASDHHPDGVEIELHVDPIDWTASTRYFIPLYVAGTGVWRQGYDGSGGIDVAVVELDRKALPETMCYHAFTPRHLVDLPNGIEVGAGVLVVCYPMGFHDTVHHMPVVRHAVIAFSFGLRFQGKGYFLTDARTHRGTSGAPVVMRGEGTGDRADELHWNLPGVHSARLDLGTRDAANDEALGLNCAWYADILMTLTA